MSTPMQRNANNMLNYGDDCRAAGYAKGRTDERDALVELLTELEAAARKDGRPVDANAIRAVRDEVTGDG